MEKLERENVNDLRNNTLDLRAVGRALRRYALLRRSLDRKETLILIRVVKGNYPLTVCNVLWLI